MSLMGESDKAPIITHPTYNYSNWSQGSEFPLLFPEGLREPWWGRGQDQWSQED